MEEVDPLEVALSNAPLVELKPQTAMPLLIKLSFTDIVSVRA